MHRRRAPQDSPPIAIARRPRFPEVRLAAVAGFPTRSPCPTRPSSRSAGGSASGSPPPALASLVLAAVRPPRRRRLRRCRTRALFPPRRPRPTGCPLTGLPPSCSQLTRFLSTPSPVPTSARVAPALALRQSLSPPPIASANRFRLLRTPVSRTRRADGFPPCATPCAARPSCTSTL